jgi:phosphatidate cytidylyltransferase
LKSKNENDVDEPTGEFPVVRTPDSRVTITGADLAADVVDDVPFVDPTTLLPHWTDAPTGQVPIVVAREIADADDPWAHIPAPAWREGEADWVAHEEQFDASVLASDIREDDSRPWEFTLKEDEAPEEEILDETPRPAPVRGQRTRRAPRDPLEGRAVRKSPDRSVTLATFTGLVLAALVITVFAAGAIPTAVLVLAVLGFAAGEAYAGFREVGAHPATILGIVAVLTLGFASYNKGASAVGAVSVLLVIFGFIWYLSAQTKIDVLDGLGATIFVYAWVGVLGSYALLLISPNTFSNKHGLAYLLGAIILTVSNDTGAMLIGRWFGRHPLNRALSPNKTIEGTIGGTILTLIIAVALLPKMSPWTMKHALAIGLAICVVAPLGDLFESMIKRTLGVKDLGTVLPGHGGLLDRVDGLLFVLPTVYYLAHFLKLS